MLGLLDFLKLQNVKKFKEITEKLHLKKQILISVFSRKMQDATYDDLKSYKNKTSLSP